MNYDQLKKIRVETPGELILWLIQYEPNKWKFFEKYSQNRFSDVIIITDEDNIEIIRKKVHKLNSHYFVYMEGERANVGGVVSPTLDSKDTDDISIVDF